MGPRGTTGMDDEGRPGQHIHLYVPNITNIDWLKCDQLSISVSIYVYFILCACYTPMTIPTSAKVPVPGPVAGLPVDGRHRRTLAGAPGGGPGVKRLRSLPELAG
jgi:hypothetical protein